MRGSWLVLACLLWAGCSGGLTVSRSCEDRIRACLATCPASTLDRNEEGPRAIPADTRTDCERRCQRTCLP
ncbi:hypothetical protein KBD49_08540 [Myxococcota bacterium]|jgi:hypothetical protein|nr:hypothetical protein [Myxococcota bacterium]